MGWRDQLRDASFRGVPFKVLSREEPLGRRVEAFEVPQAEHQSYDGGPVTPKIRVTAYVVGPNYMAERDRLKAALNRYGVGTYVDPWNGRHRVLVMDSSKVSESSAKGGYAQFEIVFLREGAAPGPAADIATRQKAVAAMDEAVARVEAALPEGFALENAFTSVLDSIEETIRDFTSEIDAILGRIDEVVQGITDIAEAVEDFADSIEELILAPVKLASSVKNLITRIMGAAGDIKAGLSIFRKFFGFDKATNGQGTQGGIEAGATGAFLDLVRRVSLVECCRLAVEADYEAREDADAVRDELLAALATLERTAEGGLYERLRRLHAEFLRHMNQQAALLPRRTHRAYHVTLPAVVIAHNELEDFTKADQIVARNGVAHPMFVPAGTDIEVLTDAPGSEGRGG